MGKELWHSDNVKKKAIEFCADLDNKSREAYDYILIPYEITADKAYSKQLYKKKYLDKLSYRLVERALNDVALMYKKGKLNIKDYEDVHSLVESKFEEAVKKVFSCGYILGSLYLGKSRNDQSATILRMYMRDHVEDLTKRLGKFIYGLKKEAKKHQETEIPGYTHRKIAMPSTYKLLLDTYCEGLKRDKNKLKFWLEQYNESPLGAGAGFGSTLNLNRTDLAKELGFKKAIKSTLDSVIKGDAEESFVFSASSILTHLSILAEDFMSLNEEGVDIFSLPKEYCLGSSIMPQKKNPDVLETIIRKSTTVGRNVGEIQALRNGKRSGYGRESQGIKYVVMNTVREFEDLFEVLGGLVKGVKINKYKGAELLEKANAHSAEIAIQKAVSTKKNFRKIKIEAEKRIKK